VKFVGSISKLHVESSRGSEVYERNKESMPSMALSTYMDRRQLADHCLAQ
jgi:hypothetical protein